MKTGDRAVFRDPLSKREIHVTLSEPVKFWVGAIQTGTGFNVRDDAGRHYSARLPNLR